MRSRSNRLLSFRTMAASFIPFLLSILLVAQTPGCQAQEEEWTHSAWLDERFLVRWTPGPEDVTFEITVATLGYVGFGISPDGRMEGSDVVIGWLQHGNVHFQDRHVPLSKDRHVPLLQSRPVPQSHSEPVIDTSQDWELLYGSENDTHTVLRFRRPYDTCDTAQDLRLTNDTLRLIYAYHFEDPVPGLPLPYHGFGNRGSRSVFLVSRVNQHVPTVRAEEPLYVWDMRNPSMLLPSNEIYWCKIFKLPDNISNKHHIVRYAPIHQNRPYMHHALVYECQGDTDELERLSREQGSQCFDHSLPDPALQGIMGNCNRVALTWASGSEGFTFPKEAGFPLDPNSGTRFFMLQTHYNPPYPSRIHDSSGLRIWYTPRLRPHDAGVLSVGMRPTWRQIIPPGQLAAVSEGHCVGACTRQALPESGVNVFAVMLHTHLMGRKVRLRHIRGTNELPPVTSDNNYDVKYQEFRSLPRPASVLPGDHLITECVYNTTSRNAITLGGYSIRSEVCLAFALYWPRADLLQCYSLPSVPTVLSSLGIQELVPGSSSVQIKSPAHLAGLTLEYRLKTYDWEHGFTSFQRATHAGSFDSLCLTSKGPLPGTKDTEFFFPNITRPYIDPSSSTCSGGRLRRKQQHSRRPAPPSPPVEPPHTTLMDTNELGDGVEEQEGLVSETSRLNIGPSLHYHCPSWVILGATSALLLRQFWA